MKKHQASLKQRLLRSASVSSADGKEKKEADGQGDGWLWSCVIPLRCHDSAAFSPARHMNSVEFDGGNLEDVVAWSLGVHSEGSLCCHESRRSFHGSVRLRLAVVSWRMPEQTLRPLRHDSRRAPVFSRRPSFSPLPDSPPWQGPKSVVLPVAGKVAALPEPSSCL